MRRQTALRLTLVLLLGTTSFFCSSKSDTSSSGSTDCGPGPYAKVIGHVSELAASGDPRPKEDVKVTFSICPDKSFTSDATGTITGNVTKGTPMTFTAEHPDDIPSIYAEWKVDADFEGSIQVVPKLFQS